MSQFLAIDLGASSGRAILGTVADGGLELEEIHRFENGGTTVNGSLVWNLLGLFAEIKTGIRKAVAAGADLKGIAVDAWGVDFALIDAQGTPIGHPYHYRDSRTDDVFDWVFDIVPRERFYAETGIQFMTINTIFQLAAMKRSGSPLLEIADKLLMIPNALTYLLCGDVSAEATIASTTQALDPTTGDWAWGLIDGLGLPRGMFPEIKKPCQVVGELQPWICAELNCPPIPVILAGSHDTASAVAAIPVGADAPDWAFLSSGTWSLLGVELDQPCLTPAALAANFTNEGCIDGRIRFLKNIMGLWIVQECRNTWRRQGQEYSFPELIAMADEADAFKCLVDPNDDAFVAPGDMPARLRAYAARTGQPLPESPGELVRCAEESLALRYRQTIEQAEQVTGKRIELLHLVGGGSQDEMLDQFTADAINRPVVTGPVEATAIGNILAQGLAVGEIGDLAEARRMVGNSFETRRYVPQDPAAWDAAYARYRNVCH